MLNVTALGGSSFYGSSPSNPGLSATGLKNGDTVSALTGLSNSFGITNTTNAGSYTMNVAGTLTNPNYTLGGTTSSPWVVNPAPVNVTALGGNSIYGSSPSNPGLSATGLKNGDTIGALTGLSNSFGISNTTNAGSYMMTVAGALTNSNYVVSNMISQTWSVNPAPIAVTALGGNSTYGTSPANPGLTATGLQNGETVSVLTGLRNSFGIDSTTIPGTYKMNVAGSLTNPNYVVTSTKTNDWSVSLRGTVGTGTPPPGSIPQQTPNDITGSINLPAASQANAATAARENAARIGGNSESNNVLPKNLSSGPSNVPSISQPPPNISLKSPELPPVNIAKSGCGPGGGGGGSGGCAEGGSSVQSKPTGIVDFALSKLNRVEMLRAFDHGREDMVDSTHTFSASLKTAIAGSSLALTVGFVGWLLRGGALLTALLSSIPVWRQLDPLTILQDRRRRNDEPTSDVDRIFDKAKQRDNAVRGASA